LERSLNILLVDDEEIIHQTIGSYLTDSGHRLKAVYNGFDALKAIESQKHDIAFIDLLMPDMDGLNLLTRLQEIRPEMPVVMIAARGDADIKNEALQHGASAFLKKPIGLLELDAILEKICSD
jgi:DNA-binding NtrC family response regulator